MRILSIILLFLFTAVFGQRNLAFDSLKIKNASELFADDYGNIYLYSDKDFGFTKYDSIGRQAGKLMFTLPVKIQSVQNPLVIPAFSENSQELKFYDQNLNEIQTIGFRQKFGYIKMAYAEDLQQIWLLDESQKRLIQYNFRDDRVLNSYPMDINFENIRDLLVHENTAYILGDDSFLVQDLRAGKNLEIPNVNFRKLRRENSNILLIGHKTISKFHGEALQTQFQKEGARIVDKNSRAYFEIRANNLYLYPIN